MSRDAAYTNIAHRDAGPSFNVDPQDSNKKQESLLALFIDRVTAGKGVKGFLKRYRRELTTWVVFVVASGFLGTLFSDLTFSGILTLGSGFQVLSYSLILLKILSTECISSLSGETFLLTLIGLVFRLVSTTQFNGYLPVDSSGDWLLQTLDALSLLQVSYIIYLMYWRLSHLKNKNDSIKAWYFIPLCLTGAPIFRANLNHHYLADNCWMFSLLVETCANMPQIVLLSTIKDEVEGMTGHYLAAQAVSKLFSLLFWTTSYKELIVAGSTPLASLTIIIAYLIQALLLGDFLYYYLKSVSNNTRLIVTDLEV